MGKSLKYPIFKDGSHKTEKRLANKSIRRCKDLENYKGFGLLKKLFNPWNICDWSFRPSSKEDIIKASRK